MSRTNEAETDYLNHLFLNADWTDIGDAAGLQNSAVAGSFFISLHTADPGEAGDQETSEATYTSYGRVEVVRTAAGWTVTGNTADNSALVTFPAATGGSETITHVGIGTVRTGAGHLIWSEPLDVSKVISSGIQPEFGIGELNIVVD